MRSFQQVLSGDRAALGTWVKLPAIESVELMALAGFDFVVIDLEHSPLSIETAATLVAVAHGRDLCPLVRVPDHSPSWVSRVLDAGAAGVIVPHVDTLDQAKDAVASARFETVGRRGVGPTTRAGSWGLVSMADYLGPAEPPFVVAQVESNEGLDSAEQVIAEGGVDAMFVGPADLSVALGKPVDHPDVAPRIDAVVSACASAGIPVGTAIGADPAAAAKLAASGYSFVMVSNDASILGMGGRALVEGFRGTLG
jgi:4-hydroxy-2-oxoheptanedioate aldolase